MDNLIPWAFPLRKWEGPEKALGTRLTQGLRTKSIKLDCLIVLAPRCVKRHDLSEPKIMYLPLANGKPLPQ